MIIVIVSGRINICRLLFQAASYLQMRITHVPVDEETMKVNVAAMKRAITKNTCMVGCTLNTWWVVPLIHGGLYP